ncbi:MAG: hypothetical protein IBX41_07865 [Methanophagales archaeon]|nr:hypothetical protein [Methanophagales archaeon]
MKMKEVSKRGWGFMATFLTVVPLLLILAVAAPASAAEGPAVMITSYTVEPQALMPGDTGTITVTIQNTDTQASKTTVASTTSGGYTSSTTTTSTISAEIDTIRLISRSREIEWLQEGTTRTEYLSVGALGPGESITISLPIKAGAYAPEGTYFPEVYIDVRNGDNVRFPVRVNVDRSEVKLLVKDIPSEISLSESKGIAIVVANNRPNAVNGVNVYVKSSTDDFEFKPAGIFIGKLEAYDKKVVNFTLTPLLEGDKNIYFEVEYKNGDNVHHSKLTSSIVVKSSSDVKLILVNAPESVYQGEVAKLDFYVANGMTKDIKAVSVVPAIEGLKILPSEYFIGDMEAGDLFSASFDLHTTNLEIGEIAIPFKLVFKDIETERQYEISGYTVQVEVRQPQKSGLPPSMLGGALVGILVIVAVVLWMRAGRKRARERRLSAKKAESNK